MIRNAIASVAVADIAAASTWYARLFGRSADTTPMSDLAEWKFEGGGWLQIYEAPDRAGNGSFTLSVTDLAGEMRRVLSAGIDVGQLNESDAVKVMMLQDPDGNSIAFAEASDPSLAR